MKRYARAVVAAAAIVSCASLEGLTGGGPVGGPLCGNGVIDPGEACDGEPCCTATCAFADAQTSCRASAGLCDVEERCTGTSAACPADGFAALGTVCRPAIAACDVVESCPGTGAACPADVSTCDGGPAPCGPALACTAPQTCSTVDAAGCTLACACADEGFYSCTSSCCATPPVAGKSCSNDGAACHDACASLCTCVSGTWSCSAACPSCPDDVPANGAVAFTDAPTRCAYALPSGVFRTCVGRVKDGATNEWSCADGTLACATPAVGGRACSATEPCADACGQACTCTSGKWVCPAGCGACPSPDQLPLDGHECLSTAGTVCSYVTSSTPPVSRCTCRAGGDGGADMWACIAEDACPASSAGLGGTPCTQADGAICKYEVDATTSATCTCRGGTWTCL